MVVVVCVVSVGSVVVVGVVSDGAAVLAEGLVGAAVPCGKSRSV